MEFVGAVSVAVVMPAVDPITSRIAYALGFKRKVKSLSDEVNKLQVERERLLKSIEDEQRLGYEVAPYVVKWLNRAEKAIAEAKAVIRTGEVAAQRSCSTNLKTRYRTCKKADQRAPGIIQLLEQRGRFGPVILIIPNLPQTVKAAVEDDEAQSMQQTVKPPVEDYKAQSRTRILNEVMEALLDPDITMVGVYGMGGIGKTVLAEEVGRQALLKKSFDYVVMVTISALPELRRIQDEIAESLTGSKLQESTDVARAGRLKDIMKGKQILMILDDMWNLLELDQVGIPTMVDGKGCKILLTSRSMDLLFKMGSQKSFHVQLLSEEESMRFFEIQVSEVKDRTTAEEILVEYPGSPMSIVSDAELLKNQDLHVGKDDLAQLKFDNPDIQDKVYSSLEHRYHLLGSIETKQIFLLCGICSPTETTLRDLLRYSYGLGLLKSDTVSGARKRLEVVIDDLKACSLLDVYQQGKVMMNGVLRAMCMEHKDQSPFRYNDGNLLEWPNKDDIGNCTRISIPCSHIRHLPEDLGCPDVEFLLLFSSRRLINIPGSTFQGTRQLKVVHFSGMKFASLPQSLHSCVNLRTLSLECCHLMDLAGIGQLENLEILSFRESNLKALPSEIMHLTRLKMLDLSHCSQLDFIPVGAMSKLTALEELFMINSFDNWEIEERSSSGRYARLSELKCLSRLTSLEICVSNARAVPKDLFTNRLEKYEIFIGPRWKFVPFKKKGGKFDRLSASTNTLKMKFKANTDLLQKLSQLLKESESLSLDGIYGLTNLFYDLDIGGFPKLKKLSIQGSSELQQIVDCETSGAIEWFPLLEYLKLKGLTTLETICQGQPAAESFSRMKRLKISHCNNLKNLFPISMVRSLSQLEEMDVSWCGKMEALFAEQSDHGYEGHDVVEFPAPESFSGMKRLKISNCNNLKNLFPISMVRSLSQLEEIEVSGCEKMEVLFVEQSDRGYEWHDDVEFPAPESFSRMKRLKIYDCNNLKNLFPISVVRSLSQLEEMDVSGCEKMEALFAEQSDRGYEGHDIVEFPRLRRLNLSNLPKLEWFLQTRDLPSGSGSAKKTTTTDKLLPFFSEKMSPMFPYLIDLSIDGRIVRSMLHSLSWWKHLPRLKWLELSYLEVSDVGAFESMPILKQLVIRDSHIEDLWRYRNGFDVSIFCLPSIRTLGLTNVNGLRHMRVRDFEIDTLTTLESLKLESCMDLISLAPSASASFCNLSTLKLQNCHKVTELIKPSTAKTMRNLVTMHIWYCDALKEIVAVADDDQTTSKEIVVVSDDDQTTRGCIVFNKLKYLNLRGLKRFKGFCMSSYYSFNFPCLETVSIYECPSMRVFCNGDATTPKLLYTNGEASRLREIRDLTVKGSSQRKIQDSGFTSLLSPFKKTKNSTSTTAPRGLSSKSQPSRIQETINLTSQKFTSIPKFNAKECVNLNLQCCINLVDVSFLLQLTRLIKLDLSGCTSLRRIPSIVELTSLLSLDLSGCSNVKELAGLPPNVEYLSLAGTAIKQLPQSITHLSSLVVLDLRNCTRLKNLTSDICKLGSLEILLLSGCINLPLPIPELLEKIVFEFLKPEYDVGDGSKYIEEFEDLRLRMSRITHDLSCITASRRLPNFFKADNLVELHLPYYNHQLLWPGKLALVNLRRINFKRSLKLISLPDLSMARRIAHLNLRGCAKLVEVSCIQNLAKLKDLDMRYCKGIRTLPSLIGLENLREFYLSGCSNLTELPPSIRDLPRLIVLDLRNCTQICELPSGLWSLESLNISGCTNILRGLIMKRNRGSDQSSGNYGSSSTTGDASQSAEEVPADSSSPDSGSKLISVEQPAPEDRAPILNKKTSIGLAVEDPTTREGRDAALGIQMQPQAIGFPSSSACPLEECTERDPSAALCDTHTLAEQGGRESNSEVFDRQSKAMESLTSYGGIDKIDRLEDELQRLREQLAASEKRREDIRRRDHSLENELRSIRSELEVEQANVMEQEQNIDESRSGGKKKGFLRSFIKSKRFFR